MQVTTVENNNETDQNNADSKTTLTITAVALDVPVLSHLTHNGEDIYIAFTP